jgi:CubicO group peptidase (beta-lactamase class C family)
MKLKLLPLVVLLFITLGLKSQTGIQIENFNEVDKLVGSFISNWKINGGSVAIAKDGRLIYNKAFGFADQKSTVMATPYNLYRVASVSKPITAIAIMKLVDEGKISLNDTIFGKGKILGQAYYNSVITDKRVYSITIRHLLEHSAGWDRNIPVDGFSHNDPAFFPLHVSKTLGEPNPVGDSTLIKFSLLRGLNYVPGLTFAYSNVGYLVLGKVIEKVSGMKYERYVQEKILKPYDIHDMHLGKNLLANKLEREVEYVSDYTTRSVYGDGSTVNCQYGGFNLEAMNAHGGWVSTAADLTKLLSVLDSQETPLLSASASQLMCKPEGPSPYYAKGWSVNSKGNRWHTGSIDGSSAFVCKTSNGYTWAFLFNSRADNSSAFWRAMDRLPWDCVKAIHEIPHVNLYAPAENMAALSTTITSQNSANISWNKGGGDARLVIASEDSLLHVFPVDGNGYKANALFGKGSKFGKSAFVVYNGNDSKTVVQNLDPSKTYYFYGFEYYKNIDTANQEVYKLAMRATSSVNINKTMIEKANNSFKP